MATPTLTCPSGPSDTGAYRLGWRGDDGGAFQVHETTISTGKTTLVYEGPATATTITGREAGSYRYQVTQVGAGRAVQGLRSESCVVEVAPPDLNLALSLLGVGGFITAAIVVSIIRGHRAHRRGELG